MVGGACSGVYKPVICSGVEAAEVSHVYQHTMALKTYSILFFLLEGEGGVLELIYYYDTGEDGNSQIFNSMGRNQ